jgi:hypothetical protein
MGAFRHRCASPVTRTGRTPGALAGRGAAPRTHGVRTQVSVAMVFAVLAFLCFAPALTDPAQRFIGAGGADPVEKMWFLSWAPYAISHHQPLLYSSAINHPTGINMMWNNSTLLLGLLLAPITSIWGPVVAYNLGMYAAVVVSAWSGYWSIGRLVPSRIGSLVGGLLYGFSPYMMGQALGHLTLTVMVYPPIVLVLFHEIVVLQRHRWWLLGVLLGVATAAQLFISEEVLASTEIAAAVGTLTIAMFHRDRCKAKIGYALRAGLVSLAVASVLCGWALWYQFAGPDQVHQTLQAFGGFVTDPLGFVLPTANQLIAPSTLVAVVQHFRGNPAEWDAYLGLPLIGVVVWAVWKGWSTPMVRVLATTAALITLLSLGPYVVLRGHQFPIPLPWLLTEHIPVLKNLLPNRFMADVYLLVGVLVAHTIANHWPRAHAARWRAGIVAVAAGLCFMPALFRPTTPLPASASIGKQARDMLAGGGVVLPSPFTTNDDPVAMLIQAESNFAFTIPGGYAYAPDLPPVAPQSALAQLDDAQSTRLREAALASVAGRAHALGLLRQAGIQTIVVLAEADAAQFRTFWTALLGERPAVYGGVAIWTDVQSVTGGA